MTWSLRWSANEVMTCGCLVIILETIVAEAVWTVVSRRDSCVGRPWEAVFVECVVFSVVVTVCSINYMYIDLQLGSITAPRRSWLAGHRELQPPPGWCCCRARARNVDNSLCFVLKSTRVYNWCAYEGSVGLPRPVLSRCCCVVTLPGSVQLTSSRHSCTRAQPASFQLRSFMYIERIFAFLDT